LDVTKIARAEQLLDRKPSRQEPEPVDTPPDLADLGRQLVTAPERGLEVDAELVVDHEPRGRERLESLDDSAGEPLVVENEIVPLLHRREEDPVAGYVAEAGDERPPRPASERPRPIRADEGQDDARLRPVELVTEAPRFEDGGDAVDELGELQRACGANDREAPDADRSTHRQR
jgi:hypothetical protein